MDLFALSLPPPPPPPPLKQAFVQAFVHQCHCRKSSPCLHLLMDSSDEGAEAPFPVQKRKRMSAKKKEAVCKEEAAGLCVSHGSMGDHLATHGYHRPEPGHSGGRKKRREECQESAINEARVGELLRKARKKFKTHPSRLPQRGSCFLVSFVGAMLMAILFEARPDMIVQPLGSWATDGTRALESMSGKMHASLLVIAGLHHPCIGSKT